MKAIIKLLYSCILLATCVSKAFGSQQRHMHTTDAPQRPQFLNDFSVPSKQLAKGVAYSGSLARLRRALHEMSQGSPLLLHTCTLGTVSQQDLRLRILQDAKSW
jgi:hypothetical protein